MLRGDVGARLLDAVPVVGILDPEQDIADIHPPSALEGRRHPGHLAPDLGGDIDFRARPDRPGPMHRDRALGGLGNARVYKRHIGRGRAHRRIGPQPDHEKRNGDRSPEDRQGDQSASAAGHLSVPSVVGVPIFSGSFGRHHAQCLEHFGRGRPVAPQRPVDRQAGEREVAAAIPPVWTPHSAATAARPDSRCSLPRRTNSDRAEGRPRRSPPRVAPRGRRDAGPRSAVRPAPPLLRIPPSPRSVRTPRPPAGSRLRPPPRCSSVGHPGRSGQ